MLLVLDGCEKCLLFANKAKDISRRKSCLWLFCYCHILKYNSLFFHVKEIFFKDSIQIYPFLLYIVMSEKSMFHHKNDSEMPKLLYLRYVLNVLCPTFCRSGPRAGSSFVSSAVPRYPGSNARSHEMIPASHPYHLQQRPTNSPGMPSSNIPAVRRIDVPGGLPLVVAAPLQPDHNGGFPIFHRTPSVRDREAENPLPHPYNGWEREFFSRFPPVFSSRDSAHASYHHAAGDSDSVNRSSSLWPRHRS